MQLGQFFKFVEAILRNESVATEDPKQNACKNVAIYSLHVCQFVYVMQPDLFHVSHIPRGKSKPPYNQREVQYTKSPF